MNCENCQNEHERTYGSGRFCSAKCARGFSTKEKRSLINEKVSLKLKKDPIKKLCNSCDILIFKGKNSKYCEECKTYNRYRSFYKKLGIDGNTNLKELNNKALNKIKDLYFKNKKSLIIIRNEYKIQFNTIFNFFRLNGIKLRDNSESGVIAYEKNRLNPSSNKIYNSNYHFSWNGKYVYLRSSYELHYAMILDKEKIDYEVEFLRIKYFDTIDKKERIAIPDFYLPESNTLVEIKSSYTLNEINMKDKIKSYIENGFNFKLYVDKKEFLL